MTAILIILLVGAALATVYSLAVVCVNDDDFNYYSTKGDAEPLYSFGRHRYQGTEHWVEQTK